jgi:hypothetical protein
MPSAAILDPDVSIYVRDPAASCNPLPTKQDGPTDEPLRGRSSVSVSLLTFAGSLLQPSCR